MNAVVLLSGGIDSAVTLAIAQNEGYDCRCLIFNCDQPAKELHAACRLVVAACVKQYKVVELSLPAQPQERTWTYPGRNLLFLSYAAMWATTVKAERIFIGANANDCKDYPDCRRGFLVTFGVVWDLALGVDQTYYIRVPLIEMSKHEIIKRGIKLKVPFELTFSCYCPVDGKHCGKCHSCEERKRGFGMAGVKDPTEYAKLIKE